MNYVTVEVEIDHGKITAKEPGQLPAKANGLLVIEAPKISSPATSPLQALEALQKHLKLDETMAQEWMETVRNARR